MDRQPCHSAEQGLVGTGTGKTYRLWSKNCEEGLLNLRASHPILKSREELRGVSHLIERHI